MGAVSHLSIEHRPTTPAPAGRRGRSELWSPGGLGARWGYLAGKKGPLLSGCEQFRTDSQHEPYQHLIMQKRILGLAVLLTSAAFGQTNKTDLAIHCVSLPGDVLGGQLCSALRLAVARSPRYEEAAVNPDGWQLRLATTGIDEDKGTAVSMTLIYRALYVVNTVQVCGASVIPDCAQGMLSDSDDHIKMMQKAVEDQVAKQLTP
jgi:hypothetical protein